MSDLPSPPPIYPPDVAAALLEAQKKVQRVAKDSTNSHAHYKYASAESMIDEARAVLNDAGLVLNGGAWRFSAEGSATREKEGKDGLMVSVGCVGRVIVTYFLIHTSGVGTAFESSTPVVTEKGRPADKAEFASLTANLAYTLRSLLLIPRGDEPGSAIDERDDTQHGAPRGAPRPQAGKPAPSKRPDLDAEIGKACLAVRDNKDPAHYEQIRKGLIVWMTQHDVEQAAGDDALDRLKVEFEIPF